MVPAAGLEPARAKSPTDFKSVASTNSAKRAQTRTLERELAAETSANTTAKETERNKIRKIDILILFLP